MWPFRKTKPKPVSKAAKRVVAGLIIGGAVGSVVGRHLVDKHDEGDDDEDNELEEEEEDGEM